MNTEYVSYRFKKKLLFTIYFILCLIVLYRYFFLQIINSEKYNIKAENNSVRKIILNAPRGIIYDRNNIPLVDNKPLYDIKLIPHDINDNFNYQLLEKYINLNETQIDSILNTKKNIPGINFKPVLIKRYVDFNIKSILEEYKLDFQGMYFSQFPARTYTSNSYLTHVLGYLRQIDKNNLNNSYQLTDLIGFSGIEKFYEDNLRGQYGVDYFFVDRLGIIQGKFENDNILLPIQGDNIVLSIDSELQYFIEKQLNNYLGTVIVMNPVNGEVLSLVSSPAYDLNSFIGAIPFNQWEKLINNKNKPFTNRAIQKTYPPGSIFKLLLAAIALEKNIIDDKIKYSCNGIYEFYNTSFRCWNEEGHGELNLSEAIKRSCNIYFYNLMQEVDFGIWSNEAREFGFHNKTFIDLPNEESGIIPDMNYMNKIFKNKGGWSKGHLLNLSIGQGEVTVTPLQIIQLINLIANNGKTIRPHINLNRKKEDLILEYKDYVWNFLKKSMYNAVNQSGGTAYNAKVYDKNVKIFGKTGTAQVCSNCSIAPHAWFAGFIEYNNKKLSICILIENGGKGSDTPAIMTKKIFQYIINNV